MKKIYLSLVAVVAISCSSNISQAQISEGGMPWSMSHSKNIELASQDIQTINVPTPDFDKAIREDAKGSMGNYRVALNQKVDITLNNSGTFYYNEDGSIIWRLSITVPGAEALALYYSNFIVPKGVRYYVTNDNRQQILGAFTSYNNSGIGFATDLVQGASSHLEMDIDAGVDINDISFTIDRVSCAYRGMEILDRISQVNGGVRAKPTDNSSACEVNANCSQGDNYQNQKDATVRIFIDAGAESGFCSGTLINNTGNSAGGNCTPLLLTASHCDGANSRDDAHYATWIFNFNYQYNNCDGTGGIESPVNPSTQMSSQSLTGATFKARSNNPSFSGGGSENPPLVGDFLLLQITQPIPSTYHAYLAGWNRDAAIPFDNSLDFFIGFHHPKGDPKKLSAGPSVDPNGTFNQSSVTATHWRVNYNPGGFEPGSSGSGLFDTNGRLIGDLSGAPPGSGACGDMSAYGEYSKLSLNWENLFDQTSFPDYAGAQSRLKDWLDPLNTGVVVLDGTKSDCSDMPVVGVDDIDLSSKFQIYPVPSTTGIINTSFNFKNKTDVAIFVYDVTGKLERKYDLSNITSGVVKYDLSDLPNGIYIMNFIADGARASKKIVIAK